MKQTKKRLGLLFKLLRQNISVWQLCGFIVANLLGGIIVLTGIQAYIDFKNFTDKQNSLLSEGHIVISKPISGTTTLANLLGGRPTFSDEEIRELEEHPSVAEVGRFTAATFSVSARFSFADMYMSTDMFMESVPDRFIDVDFEEKDAWSADINSKRIPIIIPRRYLNLYNYGYASTKGLPQLSEGLTSSFPITIAIEGNGMKRYYDGKIIGFTDRLNTILVPEEFLHQANVRYGESGQSQPSRLILKTNVSRHDASILGFLESKGYAVEGDTENIQLQTLVNNILWIVIGIGGTVSLLAFFLLLISIQLLIEKNKEKFTNLHSLGYTVNHISRPYLLLVASINSIVWILAVSAVMIIYPGIFDFFASLSPGLELASFLPLWCITVGFILFFTLLHRWIIIRELKRICM